MGGRGFGWTGALLLMPGLAWAAAGEGAEAGAFIWAGEFPGEASPQVGTWDRMRRASERAMDARNGGLGCRWATAEPGTPDDVRVEWSPPCAGSFVLFAVRPAIKAVDVARGLLEAELRAPAWVGPANLRLSFFSTQATTFVAPAVAPGPLVLEFDAGALPPGVYRSIALRWEVASPPAVGRCVLAAPVEVPGPGRARPEAAPSGAPCL